MFSQNLLIKKKWHWEMGHKRKRRNQEMQKWLLEHLVVNNSDDRWNKVKQR